MRGPWTRDLPRTLRRFFLFFPALALAGACDAGPPTAVEEDERSRLVLTLDTLNVELQNLWIRISGVPAVRQDVFLTWEIEATTANPLWRRKVLRQAGSRRFESVDTARVWGNVPRAYDFRLVVAGETQAGDFASDTLTVHAPVCRGDRPSPLCNVRGDQPVVEGLLPSRRGLPPLT